ncbi:AAA family ATPase [uncultured Robinsoniella sp.]|uniref:AAA family ATPase n=1 Tax=uncultured Robinsoniella sp. TaxID=904190 RepID=UPI00374E2D72
MKRYILYAGVNGAGKSTLYQTTKCKDSMPRINTDEIVRQIGEWTKTSDIMKAGKIAVSRLNQYLEDGITFNQETTLCGNAIYKSIKRAKQQGYLIEMHYVGLESVDLAKERIAKRVESGGHGIPDKDVERRYKRSFENLVRIIPECDLVALYDNTTEFRRFAIFRQGSLMRLSKNVPMWYVTYCTGA